MASPNEVSAARERVLSTPSCLPAHPKAHVPTMRKQTLMLFDLSHVVVRAKPNLKRYDVPNRGRVIEGNFFETVPSGADAYLLRHVLHDWTSEQCLQILDHCWKVIPKHGELLVVECVILAGNDRPSSKDFDVTMMVLPGGLERTEIEFRTLFKQADFELTAVSRTSAM